MNGTKKETGYEMNETICEVSPPKESLRQAIKEAISHAPSMYSRLILLVGPSRSGKTLALKELSFEYGQKILNVNLEISKALLEIPIQRRVSKVHYIFQDPIKNSLGGRDTQTAIILLDNLEILFDKDLKQDPLMLLQGISRNITIVASWNGLWENKRLSFAISGHPEYKCYDNINAQIIEFEKDGSL